MCLTCSRANVPCVLTCQCALHAYVFQHALCAYVLMCPAYLRAHMPCMLMCSCAYMPCVLTCSCANMPRILTCSRAQRGYVLTCQCALRAYVLTSYNKNKFSITNFPYIFVIVLCLFPVK